MKKRLFSHKDKIFDAVGSRIGFKSVFMATLGFYMAQLVVTLIFLSFIIGGCTVLYFIANKR